MIVVADGKCEGYSSTHLSLDRTGHGIRRCAREDPLDSIEFAGISRANSHLGFFICLRSGGNEKVEIVLVNAGSCDHKTLVVNWTHT
ncbi:hypothetical protein SUGI_0709850 [Cryptomeria japonica]|nr:hypothetical protein SUGI_0709850 [Cryptomeria japonica]